MGLFNKKKQHQLEEARERHEQLLRELAKPPCQQVGGKHLYRDFPAYIEYQTGRNGYIRILEPYVCVYCSERTSRLLERISYDNLSLAEAKKQEKQWYEEYKDLVKPRAIVEDMIEDAIHLDHQRLKIWDEIHAPETLPKKTEEQFLKEIFGDLQ